MIPDLTGRARAQFAPGLPERQWRIGFGMFDIYPGIPCQPAGQRRNSRSQLTVSARGERGIEKHQVESLSAVTRKKLPSLPAHHTGSHSLPVLQQATQRVGGEPLPLDENNRGGAAR
jgi:hypothetical protein